MGSYHPDHKDLYYPINYGYVAGILAGDGEEQDCYLLGYDTPLKTCEAVVIAVIHRLNDDEDKWAAAPAGTTYTAAEIKALTHFQEQYFISEIVTK